MNKRNLASALVLLVAGATACSQGDTDGDEPDLSELLARGETAFTASMSCAECHGGQAQGDTAPSLLFGPSPADIQYQLNTNPEMEGLEEELALSADDVISISLFLQDLSDEGVGSVNLAALRASLESVPDIAVVEDYVVTERDRQVIQIERFETVLEDWERRARPGPLVQTYPATVIATFDAGEPVFEPEPGRTYWYENLGTTTPYYTTILGNEGTAITEFTANSSQVVVGDAATKEVIASNELPPEFRAAVHGTVMSPDGRYIYIVGPRPSASEGTPDSSSVVDLQTEASLLKVDALTLQPVQMIDVGARMHHGQIFQDRYLLFDTFSRTEDGLNIFLLDPETDEIVGGVRDEDLGGSPYLAFTDNEFIYVIMTPFGYGPGSFPGSIQLVEGELTTMRPIWVARVDPTTWEVVREYPVPGFRPHWIVVDSASENMYVTKGASANVSKINLESGEILWTTGTAGLGPYGMTLNADESEIWTADKGEPAGILGRTVSVIAADGGQQRHTVFAGYMIDHILLAPNGRELWGTSNREGRIYVFDQETYETSHVIDMPKFGDPHGLVWVHYDENGNSMVVRDQGGFHNGVNPALGLALDY